MESTSTHLVVIIRYNICTQIHRYIDISMAQLSVHSVPTLTWFSSSSDNFRMLTRELRPKLSRDMLPDIHTHYPWCHWKWYWCDVNVQNMQMYSALPFCELLNIPILFISCLVRLAWASLWTVRLACHGGRCYLLDQQTGIVSAVELQSKIRKNFTITEKALIIQLFTWLWNLRKP